MAFINEFLDVSLYQKLAFFLSIIYIFLAIQNKPLCFVFGLFGAFFWALESYINLNLKFDALLQVFYMVMSIWGLYAWQKKGNNKDKIGRKIGLLSAKQHGLWIGIGFFFSFVLSLCIVPLISTDMAFLDILTTIFSMIGTYFLVKRYMSNWLYFIVVDIIYIYLYIQQGGGLFVLMMIIYVIMAVWGFFSWRKLYKLSLI